MSDNTCPVCFGTGVAEVEAHNRKLSPRNVISGMTIQAHLAGRYCRNCHGWGTSRGSHPNASTVRMDTLETLTMAEREIARASRDLAEQVKVFDWDQRRIRL